MRARRRRARRMRGCRRGRPTAATAGAAERPAGARAPQPDRAGRRRRACRRRPLGAAGQPEADAPQEQPRTPPRPVPAASRSRSHCRSATTQCAPHSMKKARKMSSSASRESTSCRPSSDSSSPATRPSTVEPVTRRTKRHISSTISAPTTAEAIRQPAGSIPNTLMPTAISHLPTSGWTIIDGPSWNRPVTLAVEDRLVGVLDVGVDVAEVEQRPGVLGVVGSSKENWCGVPRCQRRRKNAGSRRRSRRPSRGAGPPNASAGDSARWQSGSRRNSNQPVEQPLT